VELVVKEKREAEGKVDKSLKEKREEEVRSMKALKEKEEAEAKSHMVLKEKDEVNRLTEKIQATIQNLFKEVSKVPLVVVATV
jgi:hypothetical protein